MRQIEFFKYQGTGNDFIIIDEIDSIIGITPEEIRKLCDRHFGIGADGVIFARPSEAADFMMDYYNPDGSKAEMCGNGIRCYAAYLYHSGRATKTEIRLETASGLKVVSMQVKAGAVDLVTVDMGKPNFIPAMIPIDTDMNEFVNQPVIDGEINVSATCLSMGNPHCVIFVDDLSTVPIRDYGPRIEKLSLFPKGVNVEFAKVISERDLEIIVWERGAGETLSCGTGACAAVVAAARGGITKKRVMVKVPGGKLQIYWSDSGCVFLTGPAKEIFAGTIVLK